MTWLIFALLAALSESFKSLVSKQSLQSVSPLWTALAACSVPIPILLGWLLMTQAPPPLGSKFLATLLIGGALNIWALFLFMRALQASDLSVTIPFISFTPIFLLFTSPVLLGEVPSTQNIVGILCIVGGAYVLHIGKAHQSLWAPIQAMFAQEGPRKMLAVALIYSVSSNVDKIGVQQSSPAVWSLAITSVMTGGFLLWVRWFPTPSQSFPHQPRILGLLILIGLFQAVGLLVHNQALSMGPVPSVIAVKRSSILFATIWGILFLKEGKIQERLGGVMLMVMGMGMMAGGQG